ESPLEVPYGKMLWDKLIKNNDQIFMTLNGHYHGAARLPKPNEYGNAVEQMVVDYQMAYQGGNGLMRLYEFDLSNNEIKVISFSPWVPQKPTDTLNAFDQAVLTAPNEQFVIKMDFAKRFAGFNKDFQAGKPSHTSLVDKATAMILANYKDPEPVEQKPAADPEDYPHVVGTLAHWRFVGGTVGEAVKVGETVPDEAGQNPIRRGALSGGGVFGAKLDDLVWSDDRHHLSAVPGSVQFRNTGLLRLSYFLTDAAAPINAETLANGYTVEAIVKIDKDWDAGKHAWMNIMTRDGARGSLDGFKGRAPEDSPMVFAVSKLREIQWEVVPAQRGERTAKTNWSGEIMADKWVHIAIVGDNSTNETILYVEGAPVLRNVSNAPGVDTLGDAMPWVVGAGHGTMPRKGGFFGNISEIRVVGKPLTPEQWLTARRS
ncbi:MAG: modulator protein, partial [Paraburkholderia sp.]